MQNVEIGMVIAVTQGMIFGHRNLES